MNKAAQAYFQTKVSTTDQGQLLLLLYDGALNFLQQARDKMLAKDYAAKGILISKVIDIVNELSGTLNMEKGGTLAENLNNLYFLCTTRLLQANLKMNVEQLDSVTGILSGLRSAYAQIINTPEAQKAATQIASKLNPAASMLQRAAPITAPQAMPQALGQAQARAAYGQRGAQAFAAPAQAQPAAATVAAPVAAVQAVTPAVAAAAVAPVAPAQPVAGATVADAASPASPVRSATVTPMPPQQPAGESAVPAQPPLPGAPLSPGLAAPGLRRLTAYGKM